MNLTIVNLPEPIPRFIKKCYRNTTGKTTGVSKNSEGETLLIKAIKKGYAKSVAFLLSRGADPNVSDNRGMKALNWVDKDDQSELKKLLIAHGTVL